MFKEKEWGVDRISEEDVFSVAHERTIDRCTRLCPLLHAELVFVCDGNKSSDNRTATKSPRVLLIGFDRITFHYSKLGRLRKTPQARYLGMVPMPYQVTPSHADRRDDVQDKQKISTIEPSKFSTKVVSS